MVSRPVSICVIPAAGKGSRWAPVSGYLPKEMLPLIDRPVIEWVITEAIQSGCKEIIVVINKQKEVIKKYLEQNKSLTKKTKIHFIYQNEPKGLAHAILLCQPIIGDRPFVVALPDLPTLSHKSVIRQLVETFHKNSSAHIVSFDSFPPESSHLYTECLIERERDGKLKIIHFCPESNDPNKQHHPGNKLRLSGRFIFLPSVFITLNRLMKKFKGVQVKDDHLLQEEFQLKHLILGVQISGHTYNTGAPADYVRANTAFFKKMISKKKF